MHDLSGVCAPWFSMSNATQGRSEKYVLKKENVERSPAPPVEIKISLYAVKNVCSRISEQSGNRQTTSSNKEAQTSFTMSAVIDQTLYFHMCGNMEELFSQCSANLRSCPQPLGQLRSQRATC